MFTPKTTPEEIALNIFKTFKKDILVNFNEDQKIHLICKGMVKIFGQKKTRRINTIDRDFLFDGLVTLSWLLKNE